MFKSLLLALLPAAALAASRRPCADGRGLATLNFEGVNTPPVSDWHIIDPSNKSGIENLGVSHDHFGADIIDVKLNEQNPSVKLCLFDDDGNANFGLVLGDRSDNNFCAFRFGSTDPANTNLFLDVLRSGGQNACTVVDSNVTNDGATAEFRIIVSGRRNLRRGNRRSLQH
ncbi:hypothetical protein HDU97_002625 [Phlyctochytrium planicorne]|nr:hypothetical protein HDU97_002610 [Phlyctochytrium planicorne]KAJ3100018.1 hypothetical protein HDU97_002625 [Phlyctochytrium planicorne]